MKKQRGKHQEPKTRITECALLYSPAENMVRPAELSG